MQKCHHLVRVCKITLMSVVKAVLQESPANVSLWATDKTYWALLSRVQLRKNESKTIVTLMTGHPSGAILTHT